MAVRLFARSLVAAICVLAVTACGAEEWGDLSGRFVIVGPVPPQPVIAVPGPCGAAIIDPSLKVARGGGLANVVVYLRTRDVPVAPDDGDAEKPVTLKCVNCQLEPRVLALATTQTLKVDNTDPMNVNLKFETIVNPPVLLPIAAGKSAIASFNVAESTPIRIDDQIHPWSRGYVLVRDNPYMAVSRADGKFTIRDLPAGGELEFQLWHERPGVLKGVAYATGAANAKGRIKLTIRPGQNALGDVVVPVELLAR